MGTLVVSVDRTGDVARKTGLETPVAGWEAVQSLAVDLGLADPEDASVNCILAALRATRDLRDENVDATVAVVSGAGEGAAAADRAVARQVDALLESHGADSVVVVVDSADDERLVPVIESRVPVDAVDRVVVRQARDIESTYYLLKQFLADEELRQTVLVPLGIVLLVFPALMLATGSLAVAAAAITAVLGLFLLYKGLGVDEHLADLPADLRDALYSGRVSIVTYVVAGGLALVGVFAGALGTRGLADPSALILVMAFAFGSVHWLALAALAASAGRLIDEAIQNDSVRSPYLNLPFAVVALGFVVRGFAGYFLERAAVVDPVTLPSLTAGAVAVPALRLSAIQRLALFVSLGLVVSLAGIQVAARFSGVELEEPEDVAD